MPELRLIDRPGGHLVEHLHIDVAFDTLGDEPGSAADPATRFVAFARGPALQIIDEVFDGAALADEVWRFDALELDLGPVDVATMEAQWAARLRERLQRLLAVQQGADGHAAAGGPAAAGRRRTRRQSRCEALLHFLRHGHLPWYLRERGGDPATLAWAVLRDDASEFTAALRATRDRGALLKRLAGQFDRAWLAALLTALLPGEPAAAARLLEVVTSAGRSPDQPASDAAARAELWEAVLAQALSHGTGVPVPPRLSLVRARLQLALDGGSAFSAANDPLLGTAPLWRRLMREDRVWLRATLRRLGRSAALQRRLAVALPAALLADVVGLWWAAEASHAVTRWIGRVAGATSASAQAARQQELWTATLAQVLTDGDAGQVPVEAWRERLWSAARRDEGDGALRQRFTAALAAGRLSADPLLWQRVRDSDAAWMRTVIAGEVRAGETRRWRLARDWTDTMLLDAVGLQSPEARGLVAALVLSPHAGSGADAREQRWACTLRHLWARAAAAPAPAFDGDVYVQAMARSLARPQREDAADFAARWHAEVQRADAPAAWAARIDAVMSAEAPPAAGASPAPAVESPAEAHGAAVAGTEPVAPAAAAVPASAAANAATSAVTSVATSAAPAAPASAWARASARARDLAAQAGRALAAAVQALRRPWARAAAAEPAAPVVPAAGPLPVDNAGLVLLAPYLPRLFEHLNLLKGATWHDAQAPARALHLLQYLVDGSVASPEPCLLLNKLLCGLDPAEPVPREVGLTAAECSAADGLLQAVIQHWRALGSTTVDGLRKTFLQRAATLVLREDDAWQLSVSGGPYDMLLDHLPWGYGMVKSPWMERMLHVEWR